MVFMSLASSRGCIVADGEILVEGKQENGYTLEMSIGVCLLPGWQLRLSVAVVLTALCQGVLHSTQSMRSSFGGLCYGSPCTSLYILDLYIHKYRTLEDRYQSDNTFKCILTLLFCDII